MKSHALFLPALTIATVGGAIVAASVFHAPTRATLVGPMTLLCAGTALILFLRILFDPACHRGIAAVNRMQGDKPFQSLPIGLDDPERGLFGGRIGDSALKIVRTLLLFQFMAALLLSGNANPDLLLLAAASSAVTVLLSLLHAALNGAVTHP